MGDDRPSRYVETMKSGRPLRVVYRASGLGGCERAFVAAGRGLPAAPHPDWLLEVFDEGNRAEQQILDMWEEAGAPPTIGQQDELEIEVAEATISWNGRDYEVPVIVRAHVDGFASKTMQSTSNDQFTVLRECKKFRHSTWPTFLSKGCEINVLYPWQLAAMMHALRERDGEYPLVEMLGGHWGVPTDENGVEIPGAEARVLEIATHYVDNPPIPMRAIKKKIARIERLLAEGHDPTDVDVVCTEAMYPCPYWKLHPSRLGGGKAAAEAKLVDVADQLTDVERDAVTQEIVLSAQMSVLSKQVTALKLERDQHRSTVAAGLERAGIKKGDKATVGGWVVERVHTVVKAHEVKESTRDYVSITMKKEG